MQQFLASHKPQLAKVWYALLIVWLVFFGISTQTHSPLEWLELGSLSGQTSLVLFWIVLLPSMLKRYGVSGKLLPLRTTLTLYRRQLGIAMYIFALTHYWWSRMLPILALGGNVWYFSPFELAGLAAFSLLTPVFFTSNDWGVRTLGRHWKTLHSVVYVVIWLLFVHVGFQRLDWKAIGTLLIAVAELGSLIRAKLVRS